MVEIVNLGNSPTPTTHGKKDTAASVRRVFQTWNYLPYLFLFSFVHLAYAVDLMQSDVIKRIPPIMTVSCIYSSPSQSESVLYNILSCILSPTISTLQLRAFVCYRGVHYICFCKEYASNNELSVWVEYNDCRKKCFSSHISLIQYCIETLSLPVLLLFSKVRWKEMCGSSKDDYS